MKNSTEMCRIAGVVRALAAGIVTAALAVSARSQGVVTATQEAPLYAAGTTLEVSCTFVYPQEQALYALMWTPMLPEGWTLLSAAGDGGPIVDPHGEAILFFGTLPPGLVQFTYTVQVPEGVAGTFSLDGSALYLLAGMDDYSEIDAASVALVDVTATQAAVGYLAGTPLTIECEVAYPDGVPLYGLMWTPVLPDGWTLVSATGAGNPLVDPYGESILFFGSLQANPIVFQYTVGAPADASGLKVIGASVDYLLAGMDPMAVAAPAELTLQAMHTLEIVSAHGVPVPAAATYTNYFGTLLSMQNSASETVGTRVFACTGWSMTGNEPSAGAGTAFDMTVTGNAVLVWNWAAPLITPSGSITVEMDEDGAPTAWVMPKISATAEGASDEGLAWRVGSGPSDGSVVVTGTGTVPSIAYMPDAHWFGDDSFSVVVEDGMGGSDMLVVNVVVNSINDVPLPGTTIADQEAWEDIPFVLVVPESAFVDHDGDPLAWSATGLPGWLAFDAATRTFSGTPLEGQDGVWSITVQVEDPYGATGSQTFELVAHAVNDAPQVGLTIPDQTATEDVPFALTLDSASFTDSDAGDVLTWSAGGLPAWLHFDPPTRTFSGTPLHGDGGAFLITVTVHDLEGEECSQTFQLFVEEVNDPPVVEDLLLTTDEDTPVVGQIVAWDEEGAVLVFAVLQQPSNGSFSLAQDGTVAYVPNLDWNGIDQALVTVSDGFSVVTATITLVVNAVMDPLRLLVALERTSLETWGGELANHVYAPDGLPVTFSLSGPAARGVVTLTPGGRLDYTRLPAFASGLEFIPVMATDGQTSVALMVKVMVTDAEGEEIPPVPTYISAIWVAEPVEGERTVVMSINCSDWPVLQSRTDLVDGEWTDVPELGDLGPRVVEAVGGNGNYLFTLVLDEGPVRFFRARLR